MVGILTMEKKRLERFSSAVFLDPKSDPRLISHIPMMPVKTMNNRGVTTIMIHPKKLLHEIINLRVDDLMGLVLIP